MKQFAKDTLHATLDHSSDVRDICIPLFYIKKVHKSVNFTNQGIFSVNGPLGLGPGFESNTTKKILIVIKDHGILPFTDFFEFLGQRALIESGNIEVPHPIFGKEYLLTYTNDASFWIYWEISDEFWPVAEMLGLGSLEILNQVHKAESSGNQSDEESNFMRATGIVKRIAIISNKPVRTDGKIQYSNREAVDFENAKEIAVGEDVKKIEKVVVSGDISFANKVLKKVNVQPQQVFIL